MGYHVSILRTKDGVAIPIELSEIISATESLTEWQFFPEHTAFEKHEKDQVCTLWHSNGELWAKNPSAWAIEQMLLLAEKLNARVRGDEFETYLSSEKSYLHPDDVFIKKSAELKGEGLVKKSLHEQQRIKAVIIGFFILLSIAAYFIGASFEKR